VVGIALCETDTLGETLATVLIDILADCVDVLYGVRLYRVVGECVGVIVPKTDGESELESEALAVALDEIEGEPLVDINRLVDTV
jgi:hypothetical protein